MSPHFNSHFSGMGKMSPHSYVALEWKRNALILVQRISSLLSLSLSLSLGRGSGHWAGAVSTPNPLGGWVGAQNAKVKV